jgi:hypothetical protein
VLYRATRGWHRLKSVDVSIVRCLSGGRILYLPASWYPYSVLVLASCADDAIDSLVEKAQRDCDPMVPPWLWADIGRGN